MSFSVGEEGVNYKLPYFQIWGKIHNKIWCLAKLTECFRFKNKIKLKKKKKLIQADIL